MTKIMFFEDSVFICKFVQNILKNEPYELYFNLKAKDALEDVLKVMPDLILLNLVLDGMNGLDLCKILKKNEFLKDIPVIFVTSSDEENIIVKAFKCGACDFIVKPFKTMELIARIKCHSDNKELTDTLKSYAKKLEKSLKINEEYYIRDPLTNLFNRNFLLKHLTNSFNDNKKTSFSKSSKNDYILLADIDNLKSINDKYGHNIGDEVIITIAKMIQLHVLDQSVVGRWGGEQLLVVTKNISKADFQKMTERILDSIENFMFSDRGEFFNKSITIGSSLLDYNISIEENINNANAALYKGQRTDNK